jgi:hypothetical protein
VAAGSLSESLLTKRKRRGAGQKYSIISTMWAAGRMVKNAFLSLFFNRLGELQ